MQKIFNFDKVMDLMAIPGTIEKPLNLEKLHIFKQNKGGYIIHVYVYVYVYSK